MIIKHYIKIVTLLLVAYFISGCRYIDPFVQASDASGYSSRGEYEKAIPLYEEAIKNFSQIDAYESFEHDTRCEYALTLNEYSKIGKAEHLFTARKNFDLVLDYLRKGNKIIRCTKGVVISSRANTLQREAAYFASNEKYFELLESAYSSYQDAIKHLIKDKDWLSLAYTYFNLAETSEMYDELPKAIEWIEKAIKINEKYDFKDNLEEDSNYLLQLRAKSEEQLNKFKNENASEADSDGKKDARPF